MRAAGLGTWDDNREAFGDAVINRISEFALASRLSYFLWSSMPDDQLFELAERGELRRPEVLERQTRRLLADCEQVRLLPPCDHAEMLMRMRQSDLILSDSGGVQEEAPALGKPVLVMRETTERPEGVEAGTARLVGTDAAAILRDSSCLNPA